MKSYGIPILLLGLVLVLLFAFIGMRTENAGKPLTAASGGLENSQPITTSVMAETPAPVNQLDFSTELSDLIESAAMAISAIYDTESAKAAVVHLEPILSKLISLADHTDQVSADAKSQVYNLTLNGIANIQNLVNDKKSIAGIDKLLKPSIDSLMQALNTFISGTF